MTEKISSTAEASADILVVDDVPENLRVVIGLLKETGYKARGVPNGELALLAVAKQPPDLILLDIRMPGMDGFQVCEALRERPESREIPIIFLSALTDTADKQRAFEAGGVDYITKPFQAAEVLARINTHLELARNRSALIHTQEILRKLSQKLTQAAQSEITPISGQIFTEEHADLLIVDDEIENLRLMTEILRNTGYKVRGVNSGEMALQAVAKQPPDLILTDIIMPGMDGFELCAALRTRPKSRDIPLIFLTQLSDVENIERAFNAGAVDYIIKPIKSEEMLARVNTHLRLRRMQLGLEQMVAEQAAELVASEERYRGIFEAMEEGYLLTDLDGTIRRINPATLRLLNYTEVRELIGKDIATLLYADPDVREEFKRCLVQDGKISGFVTRFKRGDGTVIFVDINAHLIHDSEWAEVAIEGTFRDITDRKHAEEELLKLNRALHALSAGNRALVHEKSEQALLDGMCRAIIEAGYLLAWVGYAMQDEYKNIVPMAIIGKGVEYVTDSQITWADVPLGHEPTGTTIRLGKTNISHNITTDPQMAPWYEAAAKHGFGSCISLPLKNNHEIIGALSIYSAEPDAFKTAEVTMLEKMADDLSFGIINHRIRENLDKAISERQLYFDKLRASMEDALQAISTTLEIRDPYTAGHQRRVADLAVAIAREMGLENEQVHGIHLAGIVHDIGKILVPTEILSKPGQLNKFEYALIQYHPQKGYEILKDIDFPWPIAQTVLQHQERLDGSGYPQGLKNEEILLEASIISVADVVEAMSSHRPYRPGLGVEAALAEIETKSGIHFDPRVATACLTLFRERGYKFPDTN